MRQYILRILTALDGFTMMAVGFWIRPPYETLPHWFWTSTFVLAGAGLIHVAFDPYSHIRRAIAVGAAALAFGGRGGSLLFDQLFTGEWDERKLVAFAAYSLIAIHIAFRLAYWPVLDPTFHRDKHGS